jgi:hypothetical protein
MSINSKARRDARKKKAPKRGEPQPATPIQAHAHLRDADARVTGGAGVRDGEWSVILEGRVVANTDSPAMVIAMLQRIVAVREQAGHPLTLDYSDHLRDAATAEAAVAGMALDAYLIQLEAERVENAQRRQGDATGDTVH